MTQKTDVVRPKIVVVGGGFGGINTVRALKNTPVDIILVDRHNFHLFQPLLYQVATAELEAAGIAFPLRAIFRKQKNVTVGLSKVLNIDLSRNKVQFARGEISYDYLLIATGVRQSYYGNDHFQSFAPGLKSLTDAAEIRRRILLAFEAAEFEADEPARRAKLTFIVVGGGPTGVEMTGAIRDVATRTLPEEFHYIDSTTARVLLIHGGSRLLPMMPESLSERTKSDLEGMGAEIRLNSRVTEVTAEGVWMGQEFVAAENVFWAAGVEGQPLVHHLGVELDRAGRIIVDTDLSIPGHPNVFVAGDAAHALDAKTGELVPGVAQGAIQMGQFVAKVIKQDIESDATKARPAFSYVDKGSMAAIGRGKAVASVGRLNIGGFLGFMAWSMLHLMFLVGFGRKVIVAFGWALNYVTNERQARLILGDSDLNLRQAQLGTLIGEQKEDIK